MKKVLVILMTFASATIFAQNTKNFDVSNFNRLDIGSAFNINVTKGPFKVSVKGKEDDIKDVEAKVDNGELSIRYKDKKSWSMWNNHETVYLTISMPSLRAVDFSGATTSKIAGFTSKQLSIDLSGASKATFDISADVVDVECSGASDLILRGDADQLKVDLSGASELKASEFKVSEAVIEASGASDARVNVSNKIVANASGASDIKFKGTATNVKKSSSGASSVKYVD
jgi:Putative auto-transporter adhesin, head GIN domain